MFCRVCESIRQEIEANKAARPGQGISLDMFDVRSLSGRTFGEGQEISSGIL